MKFVPTGVARTASRAILHTQKASPSLLFTAGLFGVVASTVLACRATLRLEEQIHYAEIDIHKAKTLLAEDVPSYTNDDYKHDMVVIYTRSVVRITKLYGPALIVGIASIAALSGSHRILVKRNVGLTAAYAAIDKAFREYRQRVIDDVGPEKELEYRYPLEACEYDDEETGKKKKGKQVAKYGNSMYARFFDENSKSWDHEPGNNFLFLKCQQNYLNDQLRSRGHVFLNEVYDCLGIERTKAGALVGWLWNKGGDDYIDFGIFDREMTPRVYDFFMGNEGAILLDFNVDGVIYDKI